MVNNIKLYDVSYNLIAFIIDFSGLSITEEINTLSEMEFSFPLNSYPAELIKIEQQVAINETDADAPFYGRFTIKNIVRDVEGGAVNVYAVASVDVPMNNIDKHYKNTASTEANNKLALKSIQYALSSAGVTSWTAAYGEASNHPTKKKVLETEFQTVLQNIQDIAEKWDIELYFDTIAKQIKVYKKGRLGKRTATCFFWEDLNLANVTVEVDSSKVVNRVWALGKEVNGTRIDIEDIAGRGYVDELLDTTATARTTGRLQAGFYIDNEEDSAQDLYDSVLAYLKENLAPTYTFSIDISDLALVDSGWSHFEFGLGDAVKVMSKTLNEATPEDFSTVELRVVKITRYPNDPTQTKIEASSKKSNLALSQAKLNKTVNKITDTYGRLK